MQWSTAFALSETDWPGRRKKGSGACKHFAFFNFVIPTTNALHFSGSGWANTNHFIDPTTGVAAIFSSQILPPVNVEVQKYYLEFEKVLYSGLN
jgi:hypothetical protein